MDDFTSVFDRAAAKVDAAEDKQGRRPSQATRLVELGHEAELWHDAEGIPYATLTDDGHREHWPIDSRGYRDWLRRRYYVCDRRAPSGQAMTDACGVLAGIARYDSPEHAAYLRLAEHDGALYLDLCDRAWRAVEVTAQGWRLIADPPVRFLRRRGMLPLPEPVRGGRLAELWPHLHIPEDDRPLAAGWLLSALRPRGPYPVLCLQGEAGSAKSTTGRVLRSLIDPSVAMLRTTPREERDLIVAARNGWVIGLDNLSGLPDWLSDALCRLATGGGYSARELYSDAEEVLIDVQRPVLLNGIDDIASRQDLIDRSIILTLDAIPEEARRPEAEYWATIERLRPRVLGALLDATAHALQKLPTTRLERLPRMADAALWVTAAEPATGWPRGTFIAEYDEARRDAVRSSLEGSPVARALLAAMGIRDTWEGTASELLALLTAYASEGERALKSWPRSGRGLSGQLRRLATGLRSIGMDVQQFRAGHERARLIHIRKVPKSSSAPSAPSAPHAEPYSRNESAPEDCGRKADDADATADANTVCGRKADDGQKSSSAPEPYSGNGSAHADDADAKSGTFRNVPESDDYEEGTL